MLDREVPAEVGETTTASPPRPPLGTLSVTFTTKTRNRSPSSTRVEPVPVPPVDEAADCSRTGVEAGVLPEDRSGSEEVEEDSRPVVPGVTVDPRGVDGVPTVDEAGVGTVGGTR